MFFEIMLCSCIMRGYKTLICPHISTPPFEIFCTCNLLLLIYFCAFSNNILNKTLLGTWHWKITNYYKKSMLWQHHYSLPTLKSFQWAHPLPLSFIFGLFKHQYNFITVKLVHLAYGAVIQTHDLSNVCFLS